VWVAFGRMFWGDFGAIFCKQFEQRFSSGRQKCGKHGAAEVAEWQVGKGVALFWFVQVARFWTGKRASETDGGRAGDIGFRVSSWDTFLREIAFLLRLSVG